MVAPATLTRIVRVRILLPQPQRQPRRCRFLSGYSADGSALGSGPRGLEFKSPYSDHIAADEMFAAIFCFLWHRNAVPDRNPVLY